ncbi:MAG: helix-turn-helix domain-containing protein [Epsilonproteobacteria bacterium]|nr:helix-turn-helix domain-containing protein [Campylobacterota bacterium]
MNTIISKSMVMEDEKKSRELQIQIRTVLYQKDIKLTDVANQTNTTVATVSRTIAGYLHHKKTIAWIKENIGIDIPLPPPKLQPQKIKHKPKQNPRDLDIRFKKYYTPREAAFYYGFTPGSLAQMRSSKISIPYIKLGKKVLYAKEDVENYISKHSIKIKVSKNIGNFKEKEMELSQKST